MSILVAIVGAIAMAIGFVVEPTRAFAADLAVWCTATTIAFGGLAMLAITDATAAAWPTVVRRLCEGIASAFVPLAVLAVPLFIGAAHVWPWVDHPHGSYLTLPFFTVRST